MTKQLIEKIMDDCVHKWKEIDQEGIMIWLHNLRKILEKQIEKEEANRQAEQDIDRQLKFIQGITGWFNRFISKP